MFVDISSLAEFVAEYFQIDLSVSQRFRILMNQVG